MKISFSLAVSIYVILFTNKPSAVIVIKYNVHDKIFRVITFTPRQRILEVITPES